MGPHDFIDPHRPFADELNLCHVLLDDQDPHVTIRRFSPSLRELFLGYCETNAGGTFTNTRARLRDFVEHAMRLGAVSPTSAELNLAPELCRWCFVERHGVPFLLGHVLGHPTLRWGARAKTSAVFQIAQDLSWARTSGRYYLLNEYVRETLFEMQADGVMGDDVNLIHLS